MFSCVAAHGHLFPLIPLMEAAIEAEHAVSVVTSAQMADVLSVEAPPGIEHLPAGPMPSELAARAAQRVGPDADVMAPTVAVIGEIFGGVLLDNAADDALAAARPWHPDLVIADEYDTVGPLLAAVLRVPLYVMGLTPARPKSVAAAIKQAARSQYDARGVEPVPERRYIDPWPPMLRLHEYGDPALGRPNQPVHIGPHRRAATADGSPIPSFADPAKPLVLITLGTVFSDRDLLTEIIDNVAHPDINVLATQGLSIRDGPAATTSADHGHRTGETHVVTFAPMNQLLDGVSAVVGVGGAGTVHAALSRGIPMVLWPQGADQPVVARCAHDAGAALLVRSAAQIAPAITSVLTQASYRDCAGRAAAQIASAPCPQRVISLLCHDATALI